MANERPVPQNWREWIPRGRWGTEVVPGHRLPDPEMLTRAELLAMLERWGVPDVNERNLRHWEREGFLPQATIEVVGKKRRAQYPWWSADLVALLRQYQDRKLSPGQLRERLRADAHRLSLIREASGARNEVGPLDEAPFYVPRRLPSRFEGIGDLALLLRDLVMVHREHLNLPVATLDVVMTTEQGQQITYNVYPLSPDEGKREQ